MVKWTLVIEQLMNLTTFVHGTVGMFMFILEELTQALAMACYNYKQVQNWNKVIEVANYAIYEVINPAIEWINTYGHLAYPLNDAYREFFTGARKTFESYITLAQNPPQK